jgi:hypothetical protein
MNHAFFTIAQDEIDLLPVWVEHYRTYAPEAELFVLDHDSVGDASYYLAQLKADGVHVVPVRHVESFDYDWLTRVVERFQEFLLQSFGAVGFSEVDELLMPAPDEYQTLGELIADYPKSAFIKATGYCVVHDRRNEPDLMAGQALLTHRRHWYKSAKYSKVAVARLPVFYAAGFHGAYNVPPNEPPHPDLLCLHIHQIDYRLALRRHQRNAGRVWCGRFRFSPEGVHQRLDNPADLERYLLCDLDNPTEYAQLSEIPQRIKDVYRVCLPR